MNFIYVRNKIYSLLSLSKLLDNKKLLAISLTIFRMAIGIRTEDGTLVMLLM